MTFEEVYEAFGMVAVEIRYEPDLPDNEVLLDSGELLVLGKADALMGRKPEYRFSLDYMGGYKREQARMVKRGEGPRCLLSQRPGSPPPLSWDVAYQCAADEF